MKRKIKFFTIMWTWIKNKAATCGVALVVLVINLMADYGLLPDYIADILTFLCSYGWRLFVK